MATALVIFACVLVSALIIAPTAFRACGRESWTWNGTEWEPLYWLFVRPADDRLQRVAWIGDVPVDLIADRDTIAKRAEEAFVSLAPWQVVIAYIEARYRVWKKQIPRAILGAGA